MVADKGNKNKALIFAFQIAKNFPFKVFSCLDKYLLLALKQWVSKEKDRNLYYKYANPI